MSQICLLDIELEVAVEGGLYLDTAQVVADAGMLMSVTRRVYLEL